MKVDLFNNLTPTTVTNFLQYVNGNAWNDSVIHRATTVANTGLAVVQGGGFTYNDSSQSFVPTQAFDLIPLEYSRANTIGTLAMARYADSNDPTNTTTASNQWFFNTSDNSSILSQSNHGGYAVFGWIVGTGLSVIDQIDGIGTGGLQSYNVSGASFYNDINFKTLPTLTTYTASDYAALQKPTSADMVTLNSVTILQQSHPDFQNPFLAVDINNDGKLTLRDAGAIINDLLVNGARSLSGPFAGTNYLDPSGSGTVTITDARLVVTALVRQSLGLTIETTSSSSFAAPATFSLQAQVASVPEPSTIALAAIGALALGTAGVKRRNSRRGQRGN